MFVKQQKSKQITWQWVNAQRVFRTANNITRLTAISHVKLEWFPHQNVKKCDDTPIRIHNTGIGRTDRRIELVKQYRALHALHADAR